MSGAIRESLRRGFSWSLASSLVAGICQWLVVLVMARKGSAAALGEYSLAMALCGPLVVFLRLNMRTILTTDVQDGLETKVYFSARALLAGVSIPIAVAYAMIVAPELMNSVVFFGVVCYKAVESLSDIILGVLQRKRRFSEIGISTIMRGVVMVAGVWTSFMLGHDAALGVVLVAVGWVVIFLLYDCWLVGGDRVRWFGGGRVQVFGLILKCLPTGLVMMVGSLTTNIPIYAIDRYLGLEQVGYYSSVSYLLTAGGLIAAAMSQAMASAMAELYHQSAVRFWGVLQKQLACSAIVVVIVVLVASGLGGVLLSWVYGASYSHLTKLLAWIALATALSVPATFIGLAMTVARKFRAELAITALSMVIVLALSYVAVPIYGVVGAAAALCGGVATRLIIGAWVIQTDLKRRGQSAGCS